MEKFNKFLGLYELKVGEEVHHLAVTLRERGMMSSMLGKNNDEVLITFIFDRLVAGWKKYKESEGVTASKEDLSIYEDNLSNFLMRNYEDVKIGIQILFGMTTREELDEIERRYKTRFLGEEVEKTEVHGKEL